MGGFKSRDSVIKELLVKPEGFPIERSYSHMACPKGPNL